VAPGEQFYTDAVGQRAHRSRIKPPSPGGLRTETRRGEWRGVVHDSQRYRYNAADCLLAAKEARQPYYRKLRLSMAASWLSLAQQHEAMDIMLARWDTAERRISVGR